MFGYTVVGSRVRLLSPEAAEVLGVLSMVSRCRLCGRV